MASHRPTDRDRRLLLTGLSAVAAFGAGRVRAQEPAAEPQSIPLLANLFTRVGAAVKINGQGPFTFVIDTGAGMTAIADTVAQTLALPARPPLIVHGITTATRTNSVGVEELRLRDLNFDDLRCPVLPHDQLGADGLLGLDVLGRFRLGFDVVRRTASLSRNGLRIVMGGADISLGSRIQPDLIRTARGRFGQLLLGRTIVDGTSAVAFIDSGAQYSIGNDALRRAVQARRPPGSRFSRPVPLFGVTGQSLSAELARVGDIRLGRSRLGTTSLLFADLHCFQTLQLTDRPALLIGADILGRFRRVIVDFPANTVAFEGLRRQSTQTLEEALQG